MLKIIALEQLSAHIKIGDVVSVKDGFARNYLIPQRKALRFNKENMEHFKNIESEMRLKNDTILEKAGKIAKILSEVNIYIKKPTFGDGKLYGNISPTDVIEAIDSQKNILINKKCVHFNDKIKQSGIYSVRLVLHPEIYALIKLYVNHVEEETLYKNNVRKNEDSEYVPQYNVKTQDK